MQATKKQVMRLQNPNIALCLITKYVKKSPLTCLLAVILFATGSTLHINITTHSTKT